MFTQTHTLLVYCFNELDSVMPLVLQFFLKLKVNVCRLLVLKMTNAVNHYCLKSV